MNIPSSIFRIDTIKALGGAVGLIAVLLVGAMIYWLPQIQVEVAKMDTVMQVHAETTKNSATGQDKNAERMIQGLRGICNGVNKTDEARQLFCNF